MPWHNKEKYYVQLDDNIIILIQQFVISCIKYHLPIISKKLHDCQYFSTPFKLQLVEILITYKQYNTSNNTFCI